jgi:methylmalonyl-CoA/ethylmalonyl-CoA epimerase
VLKGIDHIALAVADIDGALDMYRDVWGVEVTRREDVDEQGVHEAMLALGDSWLQLIAPSRPDSTVARHIERRGEGLHHVAFEVDDLEAALADLKEKGVPLIDEVPQPGGEGASIAFVHPRGARGVLIELIQRAG